MFQDVRARRSRVGLSPLPARHRASSGQRCPQSPWWAAPAAGTPDRQRHAREAQAPGRPQRAHGECGLRARATRRGWAHPGWSPGGTPGRAREEPTGCQQAREVGYRQQQVVGPGALTPRPFQMAQPGAWYNPGSEARTERAQASGPAPTTPSPAASGAASQGLRDTRCAPCPPPIPTVAQAPTSRSA